VARFSDGGYNSHSAVLFDTGATGATALRGFYVTKRGQDFHLGRFDAAGSGPPAYDLSVLSNGNVGIGTSVPRGPGWWLDVSGAIGITNSANIGATSFASTTTWPANGGLIGWNKTTGAGDVSFVNLSGGGSDGGFGFYDRDTALMRITKAGAVGIGTLSPQCGSATQVCKLSVNGAIGAKEIVVTATGWSDYVFKPDYRLAQLSEIAAYIKDNGRLPGIPSEKEVQEKGVSLGDMQVKLLAKIEELTLHMIQSDEENRQLKARIARLEARTNEGNGR
jgi:hypothetical protein